MATVTGTSSPDILIGSSDNDVLSGLGGADELRGGGGNDRYVDTAANLSGDTITAFGVGDHILISDANLATFSYSLSGSTLTFSGGSLTLGLTQSGYLSASAALGGGVDIRLDPLLGYDGDFNRDGRSDILWRSEAGQVGNWLGTSTGRFVVNDGAALRTVPAEWSAEGRGDFNGDGRDDILWRSTSGALGTWSGTDGGNFIVNDGSRLQQVGTEWHVVGTADYNGDGRSDVLWRNNNGSVGNWLGTAAGGFAINDGAALRSAPLSWHVVASGDFNGDNRADILWRSDGGALGTWMGTASGGYIVNDGAALQQVDNSWNVLGSGDFNGDNRNDILWRNDDGRIGNWLATSGGNFSVNSASIVAVPTDWYVSSIGDYNGDLRDDLLWSNLDGSVGNWLGQTNGVFAVNNASITSVPTNWHIQPDVAFF